MDTIKDKFALVTGATKGMGRAISFALVQEGYALIACARSQANLDQLQNDIQKSTPASDVYLQPCDFSDPAQVITLLAWIKTMGFQIDVLVNNVGVFIPGRLLDEPEDQLAKHLQINLFASHHLSVAIGRQMRNRKSGHIININSVASREAVVSAASYTISKYALAGLTAVLRQELKDDNVKVTEIIPGSTLTSSWEGTAVPKEDFILPEDIAQSVISILNMSAGASVDEITLRPIKGQI